MNESTLLEHVHCPDCRCDDPRPWIQENGFSAVKCGECGIVYVTPRPAPHLRAAGTESGHLDEFDGGLSVVGRRAKWKYRRYGDVLGRMFDDVWMRTQPIRWLDVGAGFGEVVEVVRRLAPAGSVVDGIEPMASKAAAARARGVSVRDGYLDATKSEP